MSHTVITLSLVGLVLLFWFYKLLSRCFVRSFCIWNNQKSGSITQKEATILSVTTLKAGKKPLLELLVLFENLSGHPIHRKIRIWDSMPHLNRFQPDGKIPIGLNLAKRPKGPVLLFTGACRISFAYMVICCSMTVLYVVGCYFLIGEAISRINADPEKYESLFRASELWQMWAIFFGAAIFLHFLFKQIGLVVSGRNQAQNWDLLYQGLGATATIKRYWDTGTLVNDNPVVGFEYTFRDRTKQLFEGSDKKIVGKLETAALSDLEKLEIMYLPANPNISRLAENLENEGMTKFINLLFYFTLFVFSVIVVANFIQPLFG